MLRTEDGNRGSCFGGDLLTSHGAGPKVELLRSVVNRLDEAGHDLRILHGYEDLPCHIPSDVDAVSPEPTRIPYILSDRSPDDAHLAVVQAIQHETTAFYYVLHARLGDGPCFLALDVCSDYRRDGRIFFATEELLRGCRTFGIFRVPPPDLEFAYYLVKKVAKGSMDVSQAQKLSRLYGEDVDGCERWLARLFPPEEAEVVSGAAQSGEWEAVRARISSLRGTMLLRSRHNHPLRVLRYWLGVPRRVAARMIWPTGLQVVFLGADGSGKSTIIDRVEKSLAPAFRRTAQYRLRPGRPKGGASTPVTEPHAAPPRGRISSLAKLASWWADFTLGYALRVYPLVARSTLVLFDRYFQDLLVDPVRYRYSVPRTLALLVGRLIPRPHLFIVLDAPPEVLHARKQEVPFEEVARQREAYVDLARGLPEGHLVDASRPLEEVVAEVEEIVVGYLAERTSRRLRLGGAR